MKNVSVFSAVVFFLLSVALLSGCSDTADTAPDGNGVDAGSGDTGSPGADLSFPDSAQGETGTDGSTVADLPTETNPNATVHVSNLELIENAANKLSFYAEWETDGPSPTRLDVTCGDYYDTSFTDSGTRTDHEVFVMGLVQSTDCTATAYAQDDQGRLSSDSTSITIGTLPDTFPTLTVDSSVPAKIQTGWTLFNLHNGPREIPQSIVVVDAQGRYRWYYTASGTGYGLDNDVRTVPEGVLMQVPPRIVDWEGSTVWERQLHAHHDIRPIGSNGNLIFLRMGECPGAQPPADVVVEYDRTADRVVWEWSICEHYTPPEIHEDWSHLNTVEPFPNENAVLLSSRHQNAVFKVDRDTDEVVWRLGFRGDFEMDEADYSYNNHASEVTSNGNILLFDNGGPERRYSRAIEYAYDTSDWTAEVVWEYTPNPRIFCFSWGDADELPNGNRLITFGVEFPGDGQSHLMEVTADTPAQLVWDLEFPLNWSMYRAERIPNPSLGYVITD